jgi:hypothetical protein
MVVCGQLHAPNSFTAKERAPGQHSIGGSVGPTAGLEAAGNLARISLPSSPEPIAIRSELSWPADIQCKLKNINRSEADANTNSVYTRIFSKNKEFEVMYDISRILEGGGL